jgi:c-di-GMP-binding flagellar brake protein YcgR
VARSVRAGVARLHPESERRMTGRIMGGKLGCNRGSVIDISGGGMRLRSSRRLQGCLDLELWSPRRRVSLRAAVVWCQRIGFRKYEAGLQFVEVSDDVRQELTAIALFARHD